MFMRSCSIRIIVCLSTHQTSWFSSSHRSKTFGSYKCKLYDMHNLAVREIPVQQLVLVSESRDCVLAVKYTCVLPSIRLSRHPMPPSSYTRSAPNALRTPQIENRLLPAVDPSRADALEARRKARTERRAAKLKRRQRKRGDKDGSTEAITAGASTDASASSDSDSQTDLGGDAHAAIAVYAHELPQADTEPSSAAASPSESRPSQERGSGHGSPAVEGGTQWFRTLVDRSFVRTCAEAIQEREIAALLATPAPTAGADSVKGEDDTAAWRRGRLETLRRGAGLLMQQLAFSCAVDGEATKPEDDEAGASGLGSIPHGMRQVDMSKSQLRVSARSTQELSFDIPKGHGCVVYVETAAHDITVRAAVEADLDLSVPASYEGGVGEANTAAVGRLSRRVRLALEPLQPLEVERVQVGEVEVRLPEGGLAFMSSAERRWHRGAEGTSKQGAGVDCDPEWMTQGILEGGRVRLTLDNTFSRLRSKDVTVRFRLYREPRTDLEREEAAAAFQWGGGGALESTSTDMSSPLRRLKLPSHACLVDVDIEDALGMSVDRAKRLLTEGARVTRLLGWCVC